MFFLSGLETTDGKRFDGLATDAVADDLCQGFTDRGTELEPGTGKAETVEQARLGAAGADHRNTW